MTVIVIADSTCLIGLSKIDRLELLPALFTRITLAPAVWHEVVVQGTGRAGSAQVQNAAWIDVHKVQDTLAVEALRLNLGAGESESMVLARELNASLVILDDARARRTAQQLGLPIAGTAALLQRAQELGLLVDAAQAINDLRGVGFRV
jgi:predicted nucleic acid-binding protein